MTKKKKQGRAGYFASIVIYFLIGAAVKGLFRLATGRMRKGGEGA